MSENQKVNKLNIKIHNIKSQKTFYDAFTSSKN